MIKLKDILESNGVLKELEEVRVNKFKATPDKTDTTESYPYGIARGDKKIVTTYTFNELGTDAAKEELEKRYMGKTRLDPLSDEFFNIREMPKENKTVGIYTYREYTSN